MSESKPQGAEGLAALVAKWRDRQRGYIQMSNVADSEREDHRFRGRADAIQDCADELEAALAAHKEPSK